MGLLRSLRVSPKPAQRKREKIPHQSSLGRRQRVLVTILACQSNFILSFLSGVWTRHDAPCSQANAVPARLSHGASSPGPARPPRTQHRHAPAAAAAAAAAAGARDSSTKGARRASERGRRRLLPTPLRRSVMSGFPVCA